jgi:nucleoid DNA-binding protein
MRKTRTIVTFALIAGLAFTLGHAHSQPLGRGLGTLDRELAAAAKLKEEDVNTVLLNLGPAIAEQIANGRQVAVPGLGTFRVVQLEEQKNLDEGRVVTEPAVNVIEFLPDASLTQASNAPGAVPAAVVPAFKYTPLPGQTPSQKVPNFRTPSTRVR